MRDGGGEAVQLNKAERVVIAVTLAFFLLTVGFQLGRSRTPVEFSVKTASEVKAEKQETASGNVLTDGTERVNINSADAETLCGLSGIGETLAERIIAYREENGPFSRIEDITKVSGIGSSTFEKLQDRICVD